MELSCRRCTVTCEIMARKELHFDFATRTAWKRGIGKAAEAAVKDLGHLTTIVSIVEPKY